MLTDALLADPPPADARVFSARPDTLLQYLHPVVPIRDLWRHRAIVRRFARSEISGRYRGSYLGLLWSFINPLALLTVYTVVFGLVLPSRWPHRETGSIAEFALILFAGLIPFVLFSETAAKAPLVVIGVPNFVKKTSFALQVLPVALVISGAFHAGASLAILLAAQLVVLGRVPLTALLLPIVAIPLVLFALGIAWILASLGVFVRDVGHSVGVAVQFLFFGTPVFYSPEAVPTALRPLLTVNPMAWLVDSFRRVLLWGLAPVWYEWLAWVVITGAMAVFGYAWFMKTRRAFADAV
jgi:lipopolysaccharide transport system permease protein